MLFVYFFLTLVFIVIIIIIDMAAKNARFCKLGFELQSLHVMERLSNSPYK